MKEGRALKTVATILTIVALACAMALWVLPWSRRAYHIRQLQSADLVTRCRAMNAVAAEAVQQPRLRAPLTDALVRTLSEDGLSPHLKSAVQEIAAWSIRRMSDVEARLEARLDALDDAEFADLAQAFRLADRWTPERQPESRRLRLALLQVDRAEPAYLAAAIERLEAFGRQAVDGVIRRCPALLGHPDFAVRQAMIETVAVCCGPAGAGTIETMIGDPDERVRAAALVRLSLLDPRAGGMAARERSEDPDTPARRAAAWALGRSPRIGESDRHALLSACSDSDTIVAALAARALGKWAGNGEVTGELLSLARKQRVEVAIAAVRALAGLRDAAVAGELRNLTLDSLERGDQALAAACLETLIASGDEGARALMLDISRAAGLSPLLRFEAARALAALTPAAARPPLIELLGDNADAARDRAMITLLRPDLISDAELSAYLADPNDQLRGAATLTLALRGAADIPVGEGDLRAFLDAKVFGNDIELNWKTRGYYLCALAVMGDDRTAELLDVYRLNAHFPRLAIGLATVRADPSQGMTWMLANAPLADLSEVVELHFPDAPETEPLAGPEYSQWQLERLRDWWEIRAASLNPQTQGSPSACIRMYDWARGR